MHAVEGQRSTPSHAILTACATGPDASCAMPVFEPSTWAEVSEAQLSQTGSTQTTDTFVKRVRAFTDAPERFLSSTPSGASHGHCRPPTASDAKSDDDPDLSTPFPPRPRNDTPRAKIHNLPRAGANRNDGMFDDPLGFGRVDVDAQVLTRKGNFPKEVHEINLRPAPAKGKEEQVRNSAINMSAQSFDPSTFLATVHKGASLAELRSGKETLNKVIAHLDAEAEKFKRDHFVSAVLVEAMLEQTKIDLHPISPFAEEPEPWKGNTEREFRAAEQALKLRYEKVTERQEELAALRSTLAVYKRFEWVFTLGDKLRAAVAEDVSAIEAATKEYGKAQKWVDAQEDADLFVLESDIADGFDKLMDSLLNRLSTAHFSRQDTSRLLNVLSSVGREAVLTEALEKRRDFAMKRLKKASESSEMIAVPKMPGEGRTQDEATELMTRCNSALFSGFVHIWRLGRVLSGQDRWQKAVCKHLADMCQAHVEIARDNLFADVSVISRDTVKGLSAVGKRVISELQVPPACVGPLVEMANSVTQQFLRSVAVSVRSSADRVASQALQADTVSNETASHLCSIVVEALEQVDGSIIPSSVDQQGPGVVASDLSSNINTGSSAESDDVSGLTLLAMTCAEVPVMFVKDIENRMKEKGYEVETASLKMASVCSEIRSSVLAELELRMGPMTLFYTEETTKCVAETNRIVQEMQERTTSEYVRLVSAPLKTLTANLVSFPEEELEDSLSRAVPIKIDGISKGANEVTLQLALITITACKSTGSTRLLREILLALIQAIGQTLVDVLSTDKLIYHRAAQLWVDVTYIQDMITRGADSDTPGLQEALDGYSRVKERAVQAVLADGYSFSIADMSALRSTVVATGMSLAQMVQDCFRETWSSLRSPEPDEE